MTLPLHVTLAIETELRSVQRLEKTAIAALTSLIQRFPVLTEGTELGMAHPCARIVMETPNGRDLGKRLWGNK